MPKVFNVYINGTDERADLEGFSTSLANVLHVLSEKDDSQESICLEGCGVNNADPRDFGAIFTFHLEKQLDALVTKIKAKLSPNEKLILNLYGFSRGGAAVFWLCQKLKYIPAEQLEINVCALEPVPGNFIRAAYADTVTGAQTTLSSRIADLSDCDNVKKMLVLFTNEPLSDLLCHGPLLPIKPKNATMTVDLVSGCHKTVEIFCVNEQQFFYYRPAGKVTYAYVSAFLESCGTRFTAQPESVGAPPRPTDRELMNVLNQEVRQVAATKRAMHYYNQIDTVPGKPYLNLLHQKLAGVALCPSQCALTVKDPNPQASYSAGQKPLIPVGFSRGFALAGAAAAVYAVSAAMRKPEDEDAFCLPCTFGFHQ